MMALSSPRCQPAGRQRGSALLLVLFFMAVLARMALSGVDAALLGTALVLNYREHDRTFHTAESLLLALDSSLLARIESDGLQMTLGTLPISRVGIVIPPGPDEHTDTAVLHYRVDASGFTFDFSPETDTAPIVCGPLYQVTVLASGVRPGTQAHLALERRVCCDDGLACEAGDFVSMNRDWRRLDES